ncbi:conserved hypothetical protein [Pyrobaculum islandicum DSM 4184]|uniref:Uncharacterized protein n=1 Tax=Pyrobaculum islandicum (strain DSM 4184 / JCM 9189 / GEO3) TaxID=384616 RepID=A1RS67_PYRIL|nr:hypothetical protein [Pyrobaculum islandicum]ABL87799.1 conserved hypothetical protein [Pyrobaculum islandicum DSM 4184]
MPICTRWERLVTWAEKDGNNYKALEFKEKLVECIIYTATEKVKRKKLAEAEELIKYGREVAKKFGIEELNFHLSLLEKEINKIRERRKAQTQTK